MTALTLVPWVGQPDIPNPGARHTDAARWRVAGSRRDPKTQDPWLIRRLNQYRYRRLRTDVGHLLETDRFQRAQFDGFDASPLRIIEQQAPAAIHFDPRRTLHVEAAISGQHEFHYQVQIAHFFRHRQPLRK